MKLVSEIIADLQSMVDKHGDTELFHEDSECQGYVLSEVFYDENEECICIT